MDMCVRARATRALVCENIIIAAGSLGLGSYYVGFGAMVKSNGARA